MTRPTSPACPTRSSGSGPRTAWSTSSTGSSPTSTLARSAGTRDERRAVAHRRARAHAYVLLNLYPYNSGHLLVCPYRHIATYDEATPEEVAEIGELTQRACGREAGVAVRRLQHRHEPGPDRRRRHRRAPAPAHRAAVGARRELLPDHRRDQGPAAPARRGAAETAGPPRPAHGAAGAAPRAQRTCCTSNCMRGSRRLLRLHELELALARGVGALEQVEHARRRARERVRGIPGAAVVRREEGRRHVAGAVRLHRQRGLHDPGAASSTASISIVPSSRSGRSTLVTSTVRGPDARMRSTDSSVDSSEAGSVSVR